MQDFITDDKKIFVYDLDDGRILFRQNQQEKTEVASLTKIMTALIAIEKNDLNKKVTISEGMLVGLEDFVTVGLKPAQEITVEELLYAALLPSAGDAAQALAVATSGTIENFVKEMNARAKELNLKNTHFSNTVGFDEDNYSSAEDIALLTKEALKNETFKKVFETFEYVSPSLNKKFTKTFDNYDIITGGKTGFTYEAGRCFASTSNINGANLLVVNLNEDWVGDKHVENTLKIYDYYKNNYELKNIINENDKILDITVKDSSTKNLEIHAKETVSKFLEKDIELHYDYNGTNEINNDYRVGDMLGTYTISSSTETLYETQIFLEDEMHFYPYWLWNTGVVFAALIIIFFMIRRKKMCRRRRG